MSEQKIITASLEGMRVLTDEKQCELGEYDFALKRWCPKDTSDRPLTRDRANEWLAGWNALDRFATMNILTWLPAILRQRAPPENLVRPALIAFTLECGQAPWHAHRYGVMW